MTVAYSRDANFASSISPPVLVQTVLVNAPTECGVLAHDCLPTTSSMTVTQITVVTQPASGSCGVTCVTAGTLYIVYRYQ
jgi:hypothetical protein